MQETLNRHDKIALMFSGGKDSIACLYLTKDYWDKITFIWVNTGDVFPENESIVRKYQAMVPNFLEVKTDVATFKKKHGLPTDVLSTHSTEAGIITSNPDGLKLVSGFDCCAYNLWIPAMETIKQLGATLVIRGQRNDEAAKSPLRSGHTENGIEYLFPIETWTAPEVLAYLKENNVEIPEFFHFAESSLDCMRCTAFLHGIEDRRNYMRTNHPEAHSENGRNLRIIASHMDRELAYLKDQI